MKVVTPLSGGKTSGYIGANYPSDLLIFSLVCVDDPKCASSDKFLMQYANDKIQKFCAEYGEVIGTAEDPVIFKTMYQLEQLIGREIIWLRDKSFDQWIKDKNAIPTRQARWCTTFLKIKPFFDFWFKYGAFDKWTYNIGYRYDEKERVNQFTTTWSYPIYTRLYGKCYQKWVHDLEWRTGQFPLIEDKVGSFTVGQFWKNKSVEFAEDSNCQHCPFKQKPQVTKNFIKNPNQLSWAARQEIVVKYKWHKEFSIQEAMEATLETDYHYGGGAGCQAGECTN